MLDPIQARPFFAPVARGHIVPPIENQIPLLLTAYYYIFLKACPKLDHMTQFRFHSKTIKCFKVVQNIFLQKPQTKDIAQMAIVLVFHESANTKIDLYIYLRLTLN